MFAQQQTFSVHYNQMPANEILTQLENDFSLRFSYLDELIKGKKITINRSKITFDELLDEMAEQCQVIFEKIDENYYVILSNKTPKWQQQAIKEVVIKAYLTQGIAKKKDGSYYFNLNQIGVLPGITGVDVLESIQQLPGVVSLNETATNYHIRGGNIDQNKIIFDGINIYQQGHLFGMISAFNPNVVERLKFYYKGTDAGYEGGNSGIIDISTSRKIATKTQFNFGINGLSTDAVANVPLLKNKLSLLISGRTSYRNLFQTPTSNSYEKQVFQNTNVTSSNSHINDFGFYDFTAKLNYKPHKNHLFSASFLHINQLLDFENTLNNNPNNYYLNRLNSFTNGLSISAQNKLNDYFTIYSQFGISWYDLGFENKTFRKDTTELIGLINKENFVSDTYFRTELSHQNKGLNKWTLGYTYSEKRTAYLFKLTVNDKIYIYNYLKNRLNSQAVYGKYKYRNNKLFDADAGIRLQYYQEINRFYVEPRFVIGKNILPYVKLQISGEIKHQPIQQYNKTVIGLLNLENRIWQVANRKEFPIVSEKQISGGLIYKKNKWTAEVDFYHKNMDSITLSIPYRIYNEYRYLTGNASVNGVDVYVKKDFDKFSILTSYTYNLANNMFEGIKNNRQFESNFSVKHRLNFLAQYKYKQFKTALGWRWHSPRPYYKSIITENDTNENTINSDFDVAYLKHYHRFDFSAVYKTNFYNNLGLKIGFSIRNIFNQKSLLNVAQNSYSLDTSLTDFNRYSLGRTYNFSLRFFFN
jgi:hypothetical protein